MRSDSKKTPSGAVPALLLRVLAVRLAMLLAAASGALGSGPVLAGEPVEVGPGIDPPKLLRSSAIKYPDRARPAKGEVVVRAVIGHDGGVRGTEVVSSPDKRLSKAAIAAMETRTYAPATRDGRPIDVWWTESFEFIPPEEEIAKILACDPAKVDAATSTDTKDLVLPEIVRNADPLVTGGIAATGRSGRVVLQCVIDVCGRVDKCETLKSSGAAYTASAIAAAEKRLYRPATANGKPVAIYFTIVVDFRM